MKTPALYEEYYVRRDFERTCVFRELAARWHIERVLYPGSFVHITPSFVFPVVVYVDPDRKAAKFFRDAGVYDFISEKKLLTGQQQTVFHQADYNGDFGEPEEWFDLLVSQYAGFVSQACKRYLKKGGLLVANNSHGDASMASIDPDYQLTGIYRLRGTTCKISNRDLSSYFKSGSGTPVSREYLLQYQRGITYTRRPSGYVFQRVS